VALLLTRCPLSAACGRQFQRVASHVVDTQPAAATRPCHAWEAALQSEARRCTQPDAEPQRVLRCVLTVLRCVLTVPTCVLTVLRCVLTLPTCVLKVLRCVLTVLRCVLTVLRCVLTVLRWHACSALLTMLAPLQALAARISELQHSPTVRFAALFVDHTSVQANCRTHRPIK
jgi:hypothetical protein